MATVLREKTRAIQLIGAASSLGTLVPGCARAPAALRAGGIERRLGGPASWSAIVDGDRAEGEPIPEAIARFSRALADQVASAPGARRQFTVIGGDHSSAIGTWSGAARALDGRDALGLIWVDAHLDSHTPHTSPSGQYHGMPVACLLGHGDAALTGIAGKAPAVVPGRICIVGARSFEWQEPELLDRLGVRVFRMEEINARGLGPVMDEAVGIAGAGTAGIGVSIDVDALDPTEAPAVGSPVPGGLRVAELSDGLRRVARTGRVIGCEIAEYNPELDGAARTEAAVEALLAAILGETP